MKIALYSPYIPDHFGGGEKHFFHVANVLSEKHDVSICVRSDHFDEKKVNEIRSNYQAFLDFPIDRLHFIPTPLGTTVSFLEKLWWTRQFDVLYYVTDGSLFFSLAKRNILHIQIPFTGQKSSLIDRLKLANWQMKNTNSVFTKKIIEEHWQTKINFVLHPMISLSTPSLPELLSKKTQVILNVGRFFRHQHSKRQDVMVDIFKKMIDHDKEKMSGWRLVLVGSVENEEYAQEVQKLAQGYPIEMYYHVTHQQLLNWYGRAAIYWHATGFDIDEMKEPEKVEHFGISTVEAMAYACVPVVLGKGGQVEALGQDLKELLWQSPEECEKITMRLIQNEAEREVLAKKAQQQSKVFNEEKFRQTLQKMVE